MKPVHTFPPYINYVLILFSYLLLGLPCGPFTSGFPTKILCELLILPMRAKLPSRLILDLIILYCLVSHTNYDARCAVFSLCGPNIALSTLFPDTIIQCKGKGWRCPSA